MEIMKLLPQGKDYLWGGTRLREEFGKEITMTPLAETWECSVHPDGPSVVAGGRYRDRTLAQVLLLHPEFLGTKVGDRKELPVLVKLIDAKQDLSIQVHPDDEYAWANEGQNGKSEMWYVMDAEPGASLIYGFEHPVTEAQLRQAIADGTLQKHLHRVPVEQDDVFYMPAGTVHGIGAGTLIAEIQESSNVTYRVYDYDRVDKDGQKRPLHFDKAVQVMDMSPAPDIRKRQRLIDYLPGCSREVICRCKYFETELVRVTEECYFTVWKESFQILLCVEGEGMVETLGRREGRVSFRRGDCLFLPAGLGGCRIRGKAKLLKVRC